MNKTAKIIYRVVGGIILFIVGSIAVTITGEEFGPWVSLLVVLGMAVVFMKFTGFWDWMKRKK